MTEHFYRYRPAAAVLDGYHELENQEIYFSTPDELNDPMEGFKDLFWAGDEIVWRNFLKHYILCLLQTTTYCSMAADQFDPEILQKVVFSAPQSLPEAPIRNIFERVSREFCSEPAVVKFLSIVAAKTYPIRRNELTAYLRVMHSFAMPIVMKEFRDRGMLQVQAQGTEAPSIETLRRNAITMMEGVEKLSLPGSSSEIVSETLFTVSEATLAQARLAAEYNLPNRDKQMSMAFLATRFTTAYIAALDKLVHRDWYVACFARTAENHSMWSSYANGHRGICLMFKTNPSTNGTPSMPIERITSFNGKTYGSSEVVQELQPVSYTAQFPAIDFFRSLGSISEMHMNNFWYLGEDGSFSVCREAVYADNQAWRNRYWQTFGESALFKTPEWAHEQEYRIVAHSGFDMSTKDKRKLKYRFNDLAGIVFGARTDIEDKLKILRVIHEKCAKEKRSDFKFFEIRYLHAESRFQLFPLDLLKIGHNSEEMSKSEAG